MLLGKANFFSELDLVMSPPLSFIPSSSGSRSTLSHLVSAENEVQLCKTLNHHLPHLSLATGGIYGPGQPLCCQTQDWELSQQKEEQQRNQGRSRSELAAYQRESSGCSVNLAGSPFLKDNKSNLAGHSGGFRQRTVQPAEWEIFPRQCQLGQIRLGKARKG